MKNLVSFILLLLLIPFSCALQGQWLQTTGAIDTNVTQLTVLNQYLFAATTTGYNNSQILASTDDGITWFTTKTGLARVIDAFSSCGSNLFISLDDAGAYISTDYGSNWSQTNTTVEPYIKSFITCGSIFFAGTWYQGVYATTDYGVSWTQMDSGLANLYVNVLIENNSNLFAGTSGGGVYLSTNFGTSWTGVSKGIPAYYGYIDAMASVGTNIFAGTYDIGVYLSTNNGANWTAARTGLPMYIATYDQILAFASDGNNLFAGTNGGGVCLTTDNGTSWTNVSDGLGCLAIHALAVKDGYLFAGADSSIWRRPLSEMTGITDKSNDLPVKFSLEQNYPNPFNPSTKITYSITQKAHVSLSIYNSLGQEVSKLVSQDMTPGVYTSEWNAAGFASGVYYYRITAGNFAQTRKLILLK